MEKILLDEKYEQLLFQIPLLRDLPHNIKQSLLEKLEYSVYSIAVSYTHLTLPTILRV